MTSQHKHNWSKFQYPSSTASGTVTCTTCGKTKKLPKKLSKKERAAKARRALGKENMNESLRQVIRELVEDELEEMTGTGAVGGFYTPYAFSGDKGANKRKRKQTATQAGYTLSDESGEDEDNSIFESVTDADARKINQIAKKYGGKFGWSGSQEGVWIKSGDKQAAQKITSALQSAGIPIGKTWNVGEPLFISVMGSAKGKYENVNEALKVGDKVKIGSMRRGPKQLMNKTGKVIEPEDSSGYVRIRLDKGYAVLSSGPTKEIDVKADVLIKLNEGGDPYYPWRNDPEKSARAKIGEAISDVKKSLKEMNKVVNRCSRLKSETGMASDQYWNRTNKDLMKIENAITRMAQKIRQMRV